MAGSPCFIFPPPTQYLIIIWEMKCYLRVNEQRNILHEIRKRTANWIGHILPRNCLLKQGKIKWEMGVSRRQGRRKKILDDLKDRRGYSHLKEEALDRTMWRNRFGREFRPVVRQNTEWMSNLQRQIGFRNGPRRWVYHVYSKRRNQITHWRRFVCQNNGIHILIRAHGHVLWSHYI
jgi:hypothetical protein